MCILFVYVGSDDDEGDYSLVMASNRDEYYDRPSQEMTPWVEDPEVFGGRDLQPGSGGGTWLAISPTRKKIGVLLNLPGNQVEYALSRGKIVADYLKCGKSTQDYVNTIRDYIKHCNGFVLVTAELGLQIPTNKHPQVTTYSNVSEELFVHKEKYLGFGNCLPDKPLKKVEAGKNKIESICSRFNKLHQQEKLIEELLLLLKSDERHLPDSQLEKRNLMGYEYFSSIFVSIPEKRCGTRTHTLLLVTKSGHINVIEANLQSPIDPSFPKWKTIRHNF